MLVNWLFIVLRHLHNINVYFLYFSFPLEEKNTYCRIIVQKDQTIILDLNLKIVFKLCVCVYIYIYIIQ